MRLEEVCSVIETAGAVGKQFHCEKLSMQYTKTAVKKNEKMKICLLIVIRTIWILLLKTLIVGTHKSNFSSN